MRTSRIAGGALAAVATVATTALLLGAGTAVAQEQRNDQAYAIGAAGLLDLPATPFVESTDGRLVRDEVLGLGARSAAEAAGLFVGVLTAQAEAGRAESSVAELELLTLLRADLVRTWCDGDEAGLQIVNGSVLGQPLPETPVPDAEIDLSPVLNLRLNAQGRHADGSLTVHGIQVVLLPGADDGVDEPLAPTDLPAVRLIGDLLGVDLPTRLTTEGDLLAALGPLAEPQIVVVGHATCADVVEDASTPPVQEPSRSEPSSAPGTSTADPSQGNQPDSDPDTAGATGARPAPVPTIVTASLPVTG